MGKFAGPGKSGGVESLKRTLEDRSGSSTFIKNIPGEGITVRFLEEIGDWFGYYEHYDSGLKRYFPCVGDECMGCQDADSRRSLRYLTNAVDIETDTVLPLKIPLTLMNRLMTRYDKYGSVTDRDYDLIRTGKGLQTEYDVETNPPSEMKLSKYDLHDLEALLDEAWESVFGQTESTDGKDPLQGVKSPRLKAKVLDFPSDTDKAPLDSGDDDDDGYSLEELQGKSVGELKGIAKDYDVSFTRETRKAELVELIWEEIRF